MTFQNNHRFTSFAFTCLALSTALVPCESAQGAIIGTPGLSVVRFWEATGGPVAHNFPGAGTAMLTKLGVGTLGVANNDFSGLGVENYDVFYSDANGAFNANGNYVTVEGVFPRPNAGGGLNLGAVDLIIFGTPMRADILASFVGLGPNYIAGSEVLAVDADTAVPSTYTTMGSTVIPPAAHLRVTVGWTKFVPEPTSGMLTLVGGTLLGAFRRRRG